jgi:dTMP kinase
LSGFYLALEGGEGAGKTTVAERLRAFWEDQGRRVMIVREPGGTALGEQIRLLLLHSEEMTPWAEALLFAAQRSQLVAERVIPALAVGTIVISDRSLYSSLAYQGGGRGLDRELLAMINRRAVGGVVPDLVVVLEVDPDDGLARQAAGDRIGGEGREFAGRVAAAYRELAQAEPDRVVVIDTAGGPDRVAARVSALVAQRVV